jgi:RNA polymerase sigma-70 factor (ECF subfamily)
LRNIIQDSENETDLCLVSCALKGNEVAFGKIVKSYKERIERTIFSILGDTQEAEDVGQEVFIKFYYSMGNFRGDAKLITYLTRIAINLSLNELKRRKRKNLRLFLYGDKIKSGQNSEEKFIKNTEDKDLIEKAIEKLSPKLRSVIVLRFMNSYSIKEIAETLALPKGTVLSRLSKGQEKLLKIIDQLVK